jgi:glyoxylase-like metal-dependent hydrolase (beta-lactamase superfamily II)
MEIKKIVLGEMESNCYLIRSGEELCIIDPGEGDIPLIDKELENKVKLRYIINTHYHEDHTANNGKIKEKYGGKVLIHEAEKDYIDFNFDRFLKEGDIVSFGDVDLKILHIPGHSAGSICILYKNYIFTGDTVFLNGCGRWDLLGGSEKELEASLLRLSKIIKPGMNICSGHGEMFEMR